MALKKATFMTSWAILLLQGYQVRVRHNLLEDLNFYETKISNLSFKISGVNAVCLFRLTSACCRYRY